MWKLLHSHVKLNENFWYCSYVHYLQFIYYVNQIIISNCIETWSTLKLNEVKSNHENNPLLWMVQLFPLHL